MMVSMAGAATVLMIFRVEEEDQGSVAAGYVTVALVCLFIFNFAYGWGYVCTYLYKSFTTSSMLFICNRPIAWVVPSEIYPLSIRGTYIHMWHEIMLYIQPLSHVQELQCPSQL